MKLKFIGWGTGWVVGSVVVFALLGAGAAQSGSTASPKATPLTLALKFVEFKDPQGGVPLTQSQTGAVVAQINSEWSQCGINVKMERYQQVDPVGMNLPYGLSSMDQVTQVRPPFDDGKYLVIVNTGPWDHGQMGPANAWTAMPGDVPSGAVLEGPVASDGQIVAHELGHYLGLDHVSDNSDMMNPIIYSDSTKITPDQCQTMQDTARGARSGALRSV